jgi:hypothetical protein
MGKVTITGEGQDNRHGETTDGDFVQDGQNK